MNRVDADNQEDSTHSTVAIVGAGFAGLCMAIELKRAGIDSFTIYEADDEVGGTWFMLVGPNTGLGHNSIIFMIEAQARLVRQAIEELIERDLKSIDVRPAVHREFNEELQERMSKTVWTSGCESWYLEQDGKNTTLWPSYTFEYWRKTRRLKLEDFRMKWGA